MNVLAKACTYDSQLHDRCPEKQNDKISKFLGKIGNYMGRGLRTMYLKHIYVVEDLEHAVVVWFN